MENVLYEVESIRRFSGFDSVIDALSDKSTIFKFRHLLEKHKLKEHILTVINDGLKERGLLVPQGTVVDATIIHAQR